MASHAASTTRPASERERDGARQGVQINKHLKQYSKSKHMCPHYMRRENDYHIMSVHVGTACACASIERSCIYIYICTDHIHDRAAIYNR